MCFNILSVCSGSCRRCQISAKRVGTTDVDEEELDIPIREVEDFFPVQELFDLSPTVNGIFDFPETPKNVTRIREQCQAQPIHSITCIACSGVPSDDYQSSLITADRRSQVVGRILAFRFAELMVDKSQVEVQGGNDNAWRNDLRVVNNEGMGVYLKRIVSIL